MSSDRPSATKIGFCNCCSRMIALAARLVGGGLAKRRARIKPRTLILGAGNHADILWQTLGQGIMGPALDGFVALESNGAQ